MRRLLSLALMTAALPAYADDLVVGAFGGVYLTDEAADLTSKDVVSSPGTATTFGLQVAASPGFLLVDVELSAGWQISEFADGSSLNGLLARLEARYDLLDGYFKPYIAMGPALQVALSDTFGTDSDLAVAVGLGARYGISDQLSVRLDGHWIGGDGVGTIANNLEFTLGVGWTL